MADFGLAAQIGRGGGGGGGGGGGTSDPANRMMQMMQLQQLQQNMLLAREQEMRQQQLFPLQRQNLMTDIEAGRERTGLAREQRGQAAEMRQQAERTGTAERGALAYISSTSPELLADPPRLDELRKTNPGAYNFMAGEIAKTKALQEKARAENFSAEEAKFKFDQLRLGSMSSLLPGVTEQTWPTIYNQFKSLDPIGSRVIGSDFDPRNVAALTARVQNLSDLSFEKDEQGFEFILNKRTGEKTPVVKRGVNPPAASTFGTMEPNLRNPSPQLIGQGAMGLAAPQAMETPGAAPIIQPRAAAPETAGLSPRAAAAAEKTRAEETAKGDVGSEARRRGAAEVLNVLADPEIENLIRRSTSGYLQRGAAGTVASLTGVATSGMERIGQLETIAGDITMRLLGGKLGAGISNKDVELVQATLADIGNPNKPANQRLAAFRQLKKNLESISSGKPLQIAPGSASGSAAGGEVDMSNPLLGGRR